MTRLFLLVLAAAAAASSPVAADFYLQLPNGNYLFIPDLFVVAVALSIVLSIIYAVTHSGGSASVGDDLPTELSTPESADYYEDQASRARALKRKLDAETDLAESFINAKRTRAELDEIEEILRHDKAKRRR
jgi:hypothetical protein